MTDLYLELSQPDPENVGPEHPDDTELRYRTMEAMHTYEGNGGPCTALGRHKYCYAHKTVDDCQPCGAQESSVLHFTDRHDCECYCNYCCS